MASDADADKSSATKEQPAGDDGAPGSQEARRRMLGAYEAVIVIVLIFAWLLPICYVGAKKQDVRFLPKWLRHQQRISCLFTNAAGAWSNFSIQIQSADHPQWTVVPEDGYFNMPVFGYRSRLHRTLGHSYRKNRGALRIREAIAHIRKRYAEKNPEAAPLDAIRFVRLTSTSAELAKQTGHYTKPSLAGANPKMLRYFGEKRWDGKRPKHPGNGRKRKARKKRLRKYGPPRPPRTPASVRTRSTPAAQPSHTAKLPHSSPPPKKEKP